MSGIKKSTHESDVDATRATARLPGLDIEIVHRRLPEDDAEQISINLTATPSFEAFGAFLEAANPFALWAEAMRLAWFPWLEATRAVILPEDAAPSLPKTGPSWPPYPSGKS
jgi:hypothetical protein